jgi:hypothetical protein
VQESDKPILNTLDEDPRIAIMVDISLVNSGNPRL